MILHQRAVPQLPILVEQAQNNLLSKDLVAQLLLKWLFRSDGSDGQIEYVAVDGDLDAAGTWSLQALVTTADGTWNTNVGSFRVYENL